MKFQYPNYKSQISPNDPMTKGCLDCWNLGQGPLFDYWDLEIGYFPRPY